MKNGRLGSYVKYANGCMPLCEKIAKGLYRIFQCQRGSMFTRTEKNGFEIKSIYTDTEQVARLSKRQGLYLNSVPDVTKILAGTTVPSFNGD